MSDYEKLRKIETQFIRCQRNSRKYGTIFVEAKILDISNELFSLLNLKNK